MSSKLLLESHKLKYHPDVMMQFQKGEKFAPLVVEMSPSGRCNQKCQNCYISYLMEDDRSPSLMSRALFLKAIKDCADFGVKSIALCGTGEPLLNKSVPEGISYAKSLGLDICLVTNGVLATKEKMELCLGDLSYIRISTTAGSPERYAKLQGSTEEAFQVMLENLESLVNIKREKKYETTIGVSYFVLKGSEKDIYPFVSQLKEIGVDYVQIKPLGDFEKCNYEYEKSYYRSMIEELKKVEQLGSDSFNVLVRYNRFQEMEEADFGKMPSECWGLLFSTVIGSDGGVYTCGGSWYEPENCYGNLKNETLKEIWSSENFTRIFKKRFHTSTKSCFYACRNHIMNRYLMDIKNPPIHINFI